MVGDRTHPCPLSNHGGHWQRRDGRGVSRRGIQTARDVANEMRDIGREAPTAPAGSTASRASAGDGSGPTRLEGSFWIAVLPYKHRGTDPSLEALAEGMTEEIVTGLSRFSYLRVISRGSTSRYADAAVDVRAVGKEIGARYVMEGSLRHAGSQLRVAVQLVDASTGAHLWAETYTRPCETCSPGMRTSPNRVGR